MLPRVLLIVDDHQLWLNILSRFFSMYGYTIHTAKTCADAVKSAQVHHPDCLLLDYHLLDGKGAKVCRAIRSDLRLKNTPIIMISGDPAEELNAYTEYRADGFILKGDSLFKIKAVLESVLRRVRWERAILECGDLRLQGQNFRVYRESELIIELSAEQFQLLFMLLDNNRKFVKDEDIVSHVLENDPKLDKSDAVRSLVCRLRKKLGPQLARRIKNKKDKGWIYLPPRTRKSERSLS